ncbi:MAG: bifunctional adenosylcobinamide kinase/adenosylcobinamide-phosphate guanylyltransferase [Desulfococcus sp. 4484_242]|nr:MAG: bifunctional adenosylcobinamide kinase/adenosylcobinamide-phosphate guanylyltransferase [Desulfococcus sp. 4484_242]
MTASRNKDLVFVLGGARSGKSSWAIEYAEETYDSCLFLATAEVKDHEMAERVRRHQASRGPRWRLIEEALDIDKALQGIAGGVDVVLVDCLTLWLSNILLQKGREAVMPYQKRLMQVLSQRDQAVILVSNEVGAGIVPEHPLGREFRDLAGILNQQLAALADRVVLTVAGIPLHIK